MVSIFNWISANLPIIILSLAGILLILLAIFLVMIRRLGKTTRKYKALIEGAEGKNLEEIVLENGKKLQQVLFEMNIFREKLEVVADISKKSIQKVGLLRFDAFEDTGGELSYALALLNNENNGIVISSIFGRDDARTYCKYVNGGKSKHPLSKEEEKAIRQAFGLVE
ncbi:MAG: DUF4446 family protein [Clostridia bacterium]|jgi:hypothetical protein|nr:DUF4446 family protein [Clostridia bacterium]MDD4145813.1 DUF4446 family protein [Clostridia bacterium]MDD4665335.1 DUF4446 family protein [Clostridia bacterium]